MLIASLAQQRCSSAHIRGNTCGFVYETKGPSMATCRLLASLGMAPEVVSCELLHRKFPVPERRSKSSLCRMGVQPRHEGHAPDVPAPVIPGLYAFEIFPCPLLRSG